MAYSPFKMKGHTLPGIKQKSPTKHSAYGSPHPTNTETGVEEASHPSSAAAHNVKPEKESPAKQKKEQQPNRGEKNIKNEEKIEKRRKEIKEGMLNPVDPTKRKYIPRHKGREKKSPAKIAPLIAMAGKAIIGSAISGMMKKKEDE